MVILSLPRFSKNISAKKDEEPSVQTRRSNRLRKSSPSPTDEPGHHDEAKRKRDDNDLIDANENEEVPTEVPRVCSRPGCENLADVAYCSEYCNVAFVKDYFVKQFVKV